MNSKKKIREFVLLEKSTPRKGTLSAVEDMTDFLCVEHSLFFGFV